ncbi:hypothetical protein PSHT_12546 [Puccinia striiformis]|uniref:Uncharacterized protein n=3 Tax=Puccinia striiformis TaxID=27350 RepID=A0A2S4UVX1_9BASI|nr:hypothetical protein PSHT_12546 [Puccinia striiformis]
MKLTLSIPASSLLMMFTSSGVFAVGSTTYLCDNSSRNSICIKTPEGSKSSDLHEFLDFGFFLYVPQRNGRHLSPQVFTRPLADLYLASRTSFLKLPSWNWSSPSRGHDLDAIDQLLETLFASVLEMSTASYEVMDRQPSQQLWNRFQLSAAQITFGAASHSGHPNPTEPVPRCVRPASVRGREALTSPV